MTDPYSSNNGGRPPHLRRNSKFFWAAVALLIGAGLYAAAGDVEFFTHRTIGDANFSIRYPVILRQQSQDKFTVTITNPHREALLHFDTPFRKHFRITAMSPQPTGVFDTAWGRAYRFAMPDLGPASVQIEVASGDMGQINYTIVTDGRIAMLSTIILP